MPHELPGWVIYAVIGLALLAVSFFFAWKSERKYSKWLERANRDAITDYFSMRDERNALQRRLDDDASGQVARDPKTGRFTKEKSA